MLDEITTTVHPVGPPVPEGSSRPYDAAFDGMMDSAEASARRRSAAVRPLSTAATEAPLPSPPLSLEEEEDDDDDEDLEGCVDRALADAADNKARETSPHGDLSSARLRRLLCRFPLRGDNRKRSSFVALDARRLPFDIRAPLARRLSDEMNASYAREFGGSPPSPPYETVLLDVRAALLSTAYPDGYSTAGDAFEEVRVSAVACFHRRGRTNGLCIVVVADVLRRAASTVEDKDDAPQQRQRVRLRAARPLGEIPEEHVARPGTSPPVPRTSSPGLVGMIIGGGDR